MVAVKLHLFQIHSRNRWTEEMELVSNLSHVIVRSMVYMKNQTGGEGDKSILLSWAKKQPVARELMKHACVICVFDCVLTGLPFFCPTFGSLHHVAFKWVREECCFLPGLRG